MSNFKIKISNGYKRDIKKICNFMKNYNIETILKNAEENIENLSFMPRIHKTLYSYKDPNGEYRRIVSGKFIIIYKIDQDNVIILRIFSHRQDYLNPESFILKEESTTYNDIILDEEDLEEYMIKLIDEVESIPEEKKIYYTEEEFWKRVEEREAKKYGRAIYNFI